MPTPAFSSVPELVSLPEKVSEPELLLVNAALIVTVPAPAKASDCALLFMLNAPLTTTYWLLSWFAESVRNVAPESIVRFPAIAAVLSDLASTKVLEFLTVVPPEKLLAEDPLKVTVAP